MDAQGVVVVQPYDAWMGHVFGFVGVVVSVNVGVVNVKSSWSGGSRAARSS